MVCIYCEILGSILISSPSVTAEFVNYVGVCAALWLKAVHLAAVTASI